MKYAVLTFSLFISFCLSAQKFAAPDSMQVMVDVVYLASDQLEGRLTATPGEQLAANYITNRMQQLGLVPQPGSSVFQQPFTFDYRSNPHAANTEEKTGINVVGYLDNKAKTTVIIGAHFDHLGYGGIGSLHAGEPAIHNGADDNASGIAALLYVAEQLTKKGAPKKQNYLFIGFSGEELGLIGSKKWVQANPDFPAKAMFNMDMVGRLRFKGKTMAVHGVGTSSAWGKSLDAADKATGITSVRDSSGIGPSDHTSFYLDSIPVIALFTGQHEHYHKPGDDAEIVDFGGIVSVGNYLLQLIEQTDGVNDLGFQTTKQKEQREAAAFKVSLGVMPDYIYTGKGMKIDGVTEDRPGAKAGVKTGDVVTKIGDVDVEDIYDYMEGLSKFKTGQTTTIVVDRKGTLVELSVTF